MPKLTKSPIDHWLHWIQERESIRLKKAAGEPKPWTTDPILQQYRFCNVRRMDDKVSQWLLKNWYEPYFDHPNMLVACTLARHFNLPSALGTLTKIVFELEQSHVLKTVKITMQALKKKGYNIFNAAYMVRGIGEADKTTMVTDRVCAPLFLKPPVLDTQSMEACVNALLPYWGFSHFMAGQVVADLRHAVSGHWSDAKTWAPIGPGSRRGMNRLLGRPTKAPMQQEQFIELLAGIIRIGKDNLPKSITDRLEAIDWQNTLCEGDKYMRTVSGESKPKQKYQGAA